MDVVKICGGRMKKKTQSSGNTWEQLSLPGMSETSSSADSVGSRNGLGKNTYDPTWVIEVKS